jgi:hypothetical protein
MPFLRDFALSRVGLRDPAHLRSPSEGIKINGFR